MKKYHITVNGITLSFLVLGFAGLICGVTLNVLKIDAWIPVVVTGGISIFITIGCILFAYFKDSVSIKKSFLQKSVVKYSCNLNSLSEKLKLKNFHDVNGEYLKKKQIVFTKDSIYYYVKIIESDDLERSIEREYAGYVKTHNSWRFSCLMLFFIKEQIGEDDIDFVKKCALKALKKELEPLSNFQHSIIVFLADKTNDEIYFFDMQSAMSMTSYAHGCRLINNILAKKD